MIRVYYFSISRKKQIDKKYKLKAEKYLNTRTNERILVDRVKVAGFRKFHHIFPGQIIPEI